MEVVSNGPFRIAQLRWILSAGAPALTVILKTTYLLRPTESPLAAEQEAPFEEDTYWNDDHTKSLTAATDLVPFKQYPEVVLVGHAFAPRGQPVRSLIARLIVGNVNKAVEVYGERSFAYDGQLDDAGSFAKMRLSYERAAGDSSNPVGARFDVQDAYGRTRLPNLQPCGVFVARRGDTFPSISFGPIAPHWPDRRMRVQHAVPQFDARRWNERPLPDRLSASYFNIAPMDQRLESLHTNERITLENLSPEHARLTTSLQSIEPQGFVDRPGQPPTKIVLACDTLWIDTDRQICHLVWRGTVPLSRDDEPGKVVLSVATGSRSMGASDASTSEDASMTLAPFLTAGSASTLPFAGGAKEAGRDAQGRRFGAGGALPFQGQSDGSPRGPAPTPYLPKGEIADGTLFLDGGASLSPVPLPVTAPPPPTVVAAPVAPDRVIGPPIVASAWGAAGAEPLSAEKKGSIGERLAAEQAMAESKAALDKKVRGEPEHLGPIQGPANPATGPAAGRSAPPQVDIAKGGAAAASDAAAQAFAHEKAGRLLHGNAPIDLVWLHPGSVGRIRKQATWKELLSGVKPRPEDEDLDDEVPPARRIPAKDRREILTILSRGEPLDASAVEDALRAAMDDEQGFSPPLVLAAGELEMRFDELESLKALLAAVSPHTSGDKRLEEAAQRVQETLKMPWIQAANSVLDEMAESLRRLFTEVRRGTHAGVLDTHVERALLDGRHYRKRTIFGQPRLLASLTTPGMKPVLPVYLPDTLVKDLPAIRRIPVRLLAEVRPRAEQGESSDAALRALALGRVIAAGF